MNRTLESEVDDRVLRIVQSGMGDAGKMEYPEVAELAGIETRTLKKVGEHTTVRTLRKIATGLGFELAIRIEPGKPPEKFGTNVKVGDLQVHKTGEYIISCWQPTDEERAIIASGGPVWLRVMGADTHGPADVTAEDIFPTEKN